jgi:plastocyanin
MIRLARRAAPLALLLAFFLQSDALAATSNVTMTNFVFTPNLSKIKIGDTVKWTNGAAATNHTSTNDTPLALWDSGSVLPGGTFSFTFTAAGLYPYHCTFHVGVGMKGTVGLKDIVTPPSGPAGTMFTVKVASINAPAGFVYDIQKKNPGGNFQNWMLNVTSLSVIFNSTGQPTGTYQFRSRLHNTATGNSSGFSPGTNAIVT